ncbi:membrane-targeted effector domain-containing toxin [Pseudomonas palleroniana]
MKTASVSIKTAATSQTQPTAWEAPDSTYTLQTTKDLFTESIAKDLNSGNMSPDVNKMADAVRWPGNKDAPQVQVKTFAVDGVQAKDIIFIQRVPPTTDGPNIVLYIPQKDGRSFQSFNSIAEMNVWLKTLANDPTQLKSFSQHFTDSVSPAKTQRVVDTMTRFKDNDINAVVGPYANEENDIFGRLDKGSSSPPASVNGLTNIQVERTSADGQVLYSGRRADGEQVLFEYDAYGNLLGEDKNKHFYFVKNGLNNHKPLVPMTASEFKSKVQNEAANNVGANDIRGFYEELLTHLEHPFSGLGEALQVFGVNKNTANTVERYFDNPFSALLLDLNQNNQIGKVFGLDKPAMDAILSGIGDTAQGFVPVYGQARGLATLLAKIIRNEPLSDEEKRDLADGLALKPNSPARKNLPKPKAPKTPVLVPAPVKQNTGAQQEPVQNVAKPEPEAPLPQANRLRTSQWSDISHFVVQEGEQLVEGLTPNASGIYQVTASNGETRWLIRLTDEQGAGGVYEIDGRFKLRDGYVRIIDPATKKPLMTVHSNGKGGWEAIKGDGGIKWPWQSGASANRPFDPGAYDYPAPGEPSTSKITDKLDQKLKEDANRYHKSAKTKPRPVHSDLPKNATPAEVIGTVYKKSSGMILGEDHSQPSGLQFLIDNAGEFKKNGVTTLYSEGFDHALQPDLDRFFETGEISPALRKNLNLIDRPHAGHGRYTNTELLKTMREHGIRVKAIDVPSVEPKTTRIKNMNYYSSNVIESDQAIHPQGKWVARVGSEHVFNYGEPPIRGISELTGATGVSIDEAAPNKGTSVIQSRDKTEIFIDLKTPG